MTKIKICGIKTIEASRTAAKNGADFIGMVFVDNVKRKISIETAQTIVTDIRKTNEKTKIVGLFRNQNSKYVIEVINHLGLDLIQLCGNENLHDFIETPIEIFKQIRIKNSDNTTSISKKVNSLVESGIGVFLDSYDELLPGGTGIKFNWQLVAGTANKKNIFLGGGLNPENVISAIKKVEPWGVDVSTGVEKNGEKDSLLIRSFIKNVKSVTS